MRWAYTRGPTASLEGFLQSRTAAQLTGRKAMVQFVLEQDTAAVSRYLGLRNDVGAAVTTASDSLETAERDHARTQLAENEARARRGAHDAHRRDLEPSAAWSPRSRVPRRRGAHVRVGLRHATDGRLARRASARGQRHRGAARRAARRRRAGHGRRDGQRSARRHQAVARRAQRHVLLLRAPRRSSRTTCTKATSCRRGRSSASWATPGTLVAASPICISRSIRPRVPRSIRTRTSRRRDGGRRTEKWP